MSDPVARDVVKESSRPGRAARREQENDETSQRVSLIIREKVAWIGRALFR